MTFSLAFLSHKKRPKPDKRADKKATAAAVDYETPTTMATPTTAAPFPAISSAPGRVDENGNAHAGNCRMRVVRPTTSGPHHANVQLAIPVSPKAAPPSDADAVTAVPVAVSATCAGVFPRRSSSRALALSLPPVDADSDAPVQFRHTIPGASSGRSKSPHAANRTRRSLPSPLLRSGSNGNGTVIVLPSNSRDLGRRSICSDSTSSTSSSSSSGQNRASDLAGIVGDAVPILEERDEFEELDAWWQQQQQQQQQLQGRDQQQQRRSDDWDECDEFVYSYRHDESLGASSTTSVVVSFEFDAVDELVLSPSALRFDQLHHPRDLAPDPRVICSPRFVRAGLRAAGALERQLVFAIRATKWGAYFLVLVRRAFRFRRLGARASVSLRFAICALVSHEVDARRARQQRLEERMTKKMTEYRVAVECITGARGVLKFGRKGKPHVTQLSVENGETLRWTAKQRRTSAIAGAVTGRSKKLNLSASNGNGQQPQHSNRGIQLASVLQVRVGITTDVLTRAVHKGTLGGDADAQACTLSVVTRTRTLDIKAKSAEERDWLVRSLNFLVQLAREHERRVAQQAELAIMKRMEGIEVVKHGRRGRPHKTRLLVNRFGEISWLGRSNDAIQLDEIRAIAIGLETPVFARAVAAGRVTRADAFASRCFSLVTRSRSLDIEVSSEAQRDWFVVAFRYLLDKVHEKTAALQREKAEKQLRLLQELCGNGSNGPSHEIQGDGERVMPAPAPPSRYM